MNTRLTRGHRAVPQVDRLKPWKLVACTEVEQIEKLKTETRMAKGARKYRFAHAPACAAKDTGLGEVRKKDWIAKEQKRQRKCQGSCLGEMEGRTDLKKQDLIDHLAKSSETKIETHGIRTAKSPVQVPERKEISAGSEFRAQHDIVCE